MNKTNLTHIFFIVLISWIQVFLKAEEIDKQALQSYIDKCGTTYILDPKKSFKFVSPFYGKANYPPSVSCSWDFIGDSKCTVELFCKTIDLNENEDCSEEYLEIKDGVGGVERFCGNKSFEKPIRASQNLRDLFISFKSGKAGDGKKGFFCEAKCSSNIEQAKELNIADPYKEDSRCVCGLQNKDDRIVGGEDAKMNEFPWQVALVMAGTRAPKCGGSIINNNWVLTAAHCFALDNSKPESVEVLYHARLLDMTLQQGAQNVELGEKGSIRSSGYLDAGKTDADEKSQRFKVVEIINHPKFTKKYDYDVALLRLDRKIDLSQPEAPTPICLPHFSYGNESQYVGDIPYVVGWGLAHEIAGGTTRRLQKLPVPVIDFRNCKKWSTSPVTERMLCAGYEEGNRDACTGDSGGPLVLKKDNDQWEQIGIVSWGEGCARLKKPGFYSRVTASTMDPFPYVKSDLVQTRKVISL